VSWVRLRRKLDEIKGERHEKFIVLFFQYDMRSYYVLSFIIYQRESDEKGTCFHGPGLLLAPQST
jgi:hypothetical protein